MGIDDKKVSVVRLVEFLTLNKECFCIFHKKGEEIIIAEIFF